MLFYNLSLYRQMLEYVGCFDLVSVPGFGLLEKKCTDKIYVWKYIRVETVKLALENFTYLGITYLGYLRGSSAPIRWVGHSKFTSEMVCITCMEHAVSRISSTRVGTGTQWTTSAMGTPSSKN